MYKLWGPTKQGSKMKRQKSECGGQYWGSDRGAVTLREEE